MKVISTLLITLLTYFSIYYQGKLVFDNQVLKSIGEGHNALTISFFKFSLLLPDVTLQSGVVFAILFYLYFHYNSQLLKTRTNKIPFIVAIFFGTAMTLGLSYDVYNSSILIHQSLFQMIVSGLDFLGWVSLSYLIFTLIIQWMNEKYVNQYNDYFSEIRWINSWKLPLILLICWSPFLIAFWPGSFYTDSFWQLRQWIGIDVYHTQHPVISTVYFGILMDFGKNILGSVNAGAFLIVVIQTIFMTFAFTELIKLLYKLRFPTLGIYLSIAFFAICPIWPGYAQVVIKDTMNLSFDIIYIVLYIVILIDESWISLRKNLVKFFLSLLGVCCFRNTGIYLILLSLIPYIIYEIHRKHSIYGTCNLMYVCVTFLIIHIAVNMFFFPVMGVRNGPIKEMLSIPFQQTARYLKYYPGEVTEEEKKSINRVLKLNNIAKVYDPNISDPVKANSHVRTRDLGSYLKSWLVMGLRHPGVYMDATLNNIYDYFYPNGFSKSRLTGIKMYIKGKNDPNTPNDGTYDVKYSASLNTLRATRFYISHFWKKVPIGGLCYNTGIYTWILIICAMIMIGLKKYKGLWGLLPSCIVVLYCVASPVNGYVRYMLPAIAVTPLIIAWMLYSIRNKDDVKWRNFR